MYTRSIQQSLYILNQIAYFNLEEGWEELQKEADEARVLLNTKEQKSTQKWKWLSEK